MAYVIDNIKNALGKLAGAFAITDTIKDDASCAINSLRYMNITVVMLTGDNKKTADAIAKEVNKVKFIC